MYFRLGHQLAPTPLMKQTKTATPARLLGHGSPNIDGQMRPGKTWFHSNLIRCMDKKLLAVAPKTNTGRSRRYTV
jgi:hypothetical protein